MRDLFEAILAVLCCAIIVLNVYMCILYVQTW